MIIISGTIEFDPANTDATVAATEALSAATADHDGCITYDYWFHPSRPGVTRVFEEWRDDTALDAHIASEAMMTFLGAAGELGITGASLNRYDVASTTKFM